MNAFSRGLLIVALVAAPSREALGQADSSEAVQHRNDCRLAAQVLEVGEPRTKSEWARGYIVLCREDGPAALVSLWRNAGADSAEARYLITNSASLRDARLYAEVRNVAGDGSRPDVIRVAAMIVLVSYAEPESVISLSDLAPPEGPVTRLPLLGAWKTGIYYTSGAVPLPSPIAPEILSFLTGIGQAQRDGKPVWYAATALARRVRLGMQSGSSY